MFVSQQVKVRISIGHYEDTILCNLVPMETCDIFFITIMKI